MTAHPNPDAWIAALFDSPAAAEGGILRRKSADIDHIVGRARFLAEVRRRGFGAFENAGYIVVFCNGSPVIPLNWPPSGE